MPTPTASTAAGGAAVAGADRSAAQRSLVTRPLATALIVFAALLMLLAGSLVVLLVTWLRDTRRVAGEPWPPDDTDTTVPLRELGYPGAIWVASGTDDAEPCPGCHANRRWPCRHLTCKWRMSILATTPMLIRTL